MKPKNLLLIFIITATTGCSQLSGKQNTAQPEKNKYIPEYVAITPITLPPLAADTKASLYSIASAVSSGKEVPYDLDLLILPSSLSKAQYDFLNSSGSGSGGGGIFSGSASTETYKTIYDIMQMASNPLTLVLPAEQGQPAPPPIIVTPFIGIGVRVVAEYKLSSGQAKLSLPALAAELSAKGGSGSLEIQQIGITRYGTNGQGASGIDLTPDSIDFALKSIGMLMAQIWLKDTRIQPMIVGYSVNGYTNIDIKHHPYIVQQIIDRRKEVTDPFVQSMFHEAQYELGLTGRLTARSEKDKTDYNAKMEALKSGLITEKLRALTVSNIALKDPENLSKVTDSLLEKHIPNQLIKFDDVNTRILQEIRSK